MWGKYFLLVMEVGIPFHSRGTVGHASAWTHKQNNCCINPFRELALILIVVDRLIVLQRLNIWRDSRLCWFWWCSVVSCEDITSIPSLCILDLNILIVKLQKHYLNILTNDLKQYIHYFYHDSFENHVATSCYENNYVYYRTFHFFEPNLSSSNLDFAHAWS